MKISLTLSFIFCSVFCFAQNIPIGNWKEYLPYGNAIAVSASDNKIYCATQLSLYSVNKSDGSFERYSKVTGLSDIGYSAIEFDKTHQLLLIAYANSNIDLLKGNQVINIPDIKLKNIVGDKSIYHIFFYGDFAYLSCGFGIVVIDLVKNEINDTYFITPGGGPGRVNAFCSDGTKFYAATPNGIITADVNNLNLAYFANWTNISGSAGLPKGEAKRILFADNKVYCSVNDTLFEYGGSVWNKIYYESNWKINSISKGVNGIIISENTSDISKAKLLVFKNSILTDSVQGYYIKNPLQASQDPDGSYWIADFYMGLVYRKDITTIYPIYPNGPGNVRVSDIAIRNHNVYVATGGVSDWNYTYSRIGFYTRINDNWNSIHQYVDSRLDSVFDIFITAVNPKTNLAYFGSYGGGLVEFDNNSITNLFKQNSSLKSATGDPGSYRVAGIAFDNDGNMWLSNYGSPNPICLRTVDNKWYSFQPNVADAGGALGQVVVDQNNYKWFVLTRGNGILVYDSGDKIDDPSDDRYRSLGLGVGKGNLPNLAVNCLAVDKDGYIWVGTDQGVAVYYCPSEIFSSSGCDAQQILVKQDQYYNYLLITETINAIVVDGANRKWFATDNGVFLMSADGTKQIYHFTESNSPLFSNFTTSIAIDDKTGEVFIGTEKGIEVFRAEATDEDVTDCKPFVYPNPVREDYTGPIAIKGLVSNSQVKITDVGGDLVYQTTALGTQAIWDGKTLKGDRAATGVYLVFAASPDGTKSCVTKLVLIH